MWIVKTITSLKLSNFDYLFFFFAGAALSMAHPPISFPYVIIFVLAIAGRYWSDKTPNHKESFFWGWLFGFGYFSFSLIWITEPFLVKPKETGIFAPFALFSLAASLSIFWGLAFLFGSLTNDYRSKYRSILKLAAFLSLAELLRSFIFTGFPWVIIGIAFTETSLGQSLALFGPYWLTSIIIFLSCLILTGFKGFLITIIGFTCLFLYGKNRTDNIINSQVGVKVRIVQPNINQEKKWKLELASSHLEKLFSLSNKNLEGVDLVIWPETAIQLFLEYQKDFSKQLSEKIGKPIVLGARKYLRKEHELFNSAYALDDMGQIINSYDKKHLVPFGEYIPFVNSINKLGIKGFASNGISGFTIGTRENRMHIKDIPPFAIMICYESIFSYEIDVNIEEVDWLIHLTNDAWFGSYSGPQQHLIHSQARAIEQGLPVFRSANTGISALIDPYGRIIHKLDLNTEGYFDAKLPNRLKTTTYASFGAKNWNMILVSLIVLVAYLCFKRPKKSFEF